MNALLLLALLACGPKKGTVEASRAADLPAMPTPAEPTAFEAPVPAEFVLSNGARVWLVEKHDLPLVSLRIVVPGGAAADPGDRPGLTSLADELLLRGAGDRDAVAFAEAAEDEAIQLDVSTDPRATLVSVDVEAGRLDTALGLVADALQRPRFDDDEVARARDQRLGDLAEQHDDIRTVASMAGVRAWYGDAHPLGHWRDGTVEAVTGFDAAALRSSWEARSNAAAAVVVAVGDVDAATLQDRLEAHLGTWSGNGQALAALPAPAGGPRLVLVDQPGSAQAVLWMALPGWTSTDPEAPAARMAVKVLGGTFTSRLNRLLREEKGYTYGAFARTDHHPEWGSVFAATAVQAEVAGPALADLVAETRRLAEGITQAEVDKAKGAARTDVIELVGTRATLADELADLAAQGRGPDALEADLAAEQAVTLDTASKHVALAMDEAVIVVAGDLSVIRAAVEQAVPGQWEVHAP